MGVGAGSKIEFVIDGDDIRVKPVKTLTVADLYGSFPPFVGASADLRREIDEGMAAEADRILAEMSAS